MPCRGFTRITYAKRLKYHKDLIDFDFGKYNLTFSEPPITSKKQQIASLGSLVVEAHEQLQKIDVSGPFIARTRDLEWG